jgi:hypothetical protein
LVPFFWRILIKQLRTPKYKRGTLPSAGEDGEGLPCCIGSINWHNHFGKLLGFTKPSSP